MIINTLPAHYRERVSNEKGLGLSPPRWPSADWWTAHAFESIMENSMQVSSSKKAKVYMKVNSEATAPPEMPTRIYSYLHPICVGSF
ncbi:jg5873 [Pararge aegeria aegeria]|uniref:Jg5873 protein n=1 Tax=Pararge aegeria aegeria TaxID=348720 RepID=A0A8S4REG9_9NEOP|nr:jg5873 [Pararge aegeria aegeria]